MKNFYEKKSIGKIFRNFKKSSQCSNAKIFDFKIL